MRSKSDGTLIWHTESREIKSLRPWPRNPNTMTEAEFDRLGKSMKEMGYAEDIVCNLDGMIIGGYHRWLHLKKQGITTADVRLPNRLLSESEVDKLGLYLNQGGKFDKQLLLKNWEEKELLDAGLTKQDITVRDSYADYDKVDGAASTPSPEEEELVKFEVAMLPEDWEVLNKVLSNIEVKYRTKVAALRIGLKLGQLIKGVVWDR